MADGSRGGGASHLGALLPALRARGVDVEVAIGPGPAGDRLEAEGFAVRRLDLFAGRASRRAFVDMAAILRDARADLIHLHGTRAAFYGALASRFGRAVPLVYTAHLLAHTRRDAGPLVRSALYGGELVAARSARRVIAVSKAYARALVEDRLAPAERVRWIPNPVALERFGRISRAEARARLGLPDGARIVGCVARLVPQKGVEVLVDACARLRDVKLVVVGDGSEREALEARARAARLDASFLGARDDVAELLPAFDVFALTSHWEAEGIALVEALASGVPCVATATHGASEILAAGAGVLAPIGDAAAVAEALASLFAEPLRRAELAARGPARIEARAPSRVAESTLAIYEEALSS